MLRAAGLILIAAIGAYAVPAEAFRCGNRIVTEGDDISRVRHLCGEPHSVQLWTEIRVRPLYGYGYVHGRRLPVEIQVEEWTYNLGSRRFMRRLRFENGRLVDVRPLRYGY